MTDRSPRTPRPPARRRLRLRHVLFAVLLFSGIIPLVISNVLLIRQNRERLEADERTELTQAADALSREMDEQLEDVRGRLAQIGGALLLAPGAEPIEVRLAQDWVGEYLGRFGASSDLVALWVLDVDGMGRRLGPRDLPAEVTEVRQVTFDRAREEGETAYGFVVLPTRNEPVASVAVPVEPPAGGEPLVVEALVRLPLEEMVSRREQLEAQVGILLTGADGRVLWSEGASPAAREALVASGATDTVSPLSPAMTTEYPVVQPDGGSVRMLAQVVTVGDTGWAVAVQKPASAAFAAVDQMVWNALVATVLLLAVALGFAVIAARWVSRPIQRLAETSHEIAEGNFGRRVEAEGLSVELAELARDFNRMSAHVESYVERLRQAAQANRDLFIGSIRSFAAAIDAKDPYTRGHSERVAALARTIARHLQLPESQQQKIWIGALLHDVGKIGVEDQILRKVGQLTDEEYEQMKSHTVVGAEIMSSIDPLREMVPTIRWHHEAWNGRGYPDGKRGEEIPLPARIVAVADTFDAVTTNRPYQKAFSMDEAIGIITKLTGTRFDAKVVTAFLRAYENGEVRLPDPGPEPEKVAAIRTSDEVAPAAF